MKMTDAMRADAARQPVMTEEEAHALGDRFRMALLADGYRIEDGCIVEIPEHRELHAKLLEMSFTDEV